MTYPPSQDPNGTQGQPTPGSPQQPGLQGPAGGYPTPGRSSKTMWIIIAVVAVLLVAGIVVSIILLTRNNNSSAANASTTNSTSTSATASPTTTTATGNSDPEASAVGKKYVDSIDGRDVSGFLATICPSKRQQIQQQLSGPDNPLGPDSKLMLTFTGVQTNGNNGTVNYVTNVEPNGQQVNKPDNDVMLKENGQWTVCPVLSN